MVRNAKTRRNNSVLMHNIRRQTEMFNIYSGNVYPTSPTYYSTSIGQKKNFTETDKKDEVNYETIPRTQNDYSAVLPSIHRGSPENKNFLKSNMSIANQVIRSYRSFSRRHAYNTRFEVSEQSEDHFGNKTIDMAKESTSTKTNSSPKAQRDRAKSQLSKTESQIPERVIQVKPIDGRQMLESIKETKESEQQ